MFNKFEFVPTKFHNIYVAQSDKDILIMPVFSSLCKLLKFYKENGLYEELNVKNGNNKRCLLCDTGGMNAKNAKRHKTGTKHQRENLSLVTDIQTAIEAFQAISTFSDLIEEVTLPKWKLDLKARMFDYMKSAGDKDKSKAIRFYGEMNKLLLKYRHMEQSSLLELAVWKAEVVNNIEFDSMQELREYSFLEEDFNVESYLQDRRIASGIEVIVPNVMKFLLKRRKISSHSSFTS